MGPEEETNRLLNYSRMMSNIERRQHKQIEETDSGAKAWIPTFVLSV